MGIVLSTPSSHLDDLAVFVAASPTNYHIASSMALHLAGAGFVPVDEKGRFPRGAGRLFVVRHGAVIAWRQPKHIDNATRLRVVSAHTDSPALKVKPEASFSFRGWGQTTIGIYGGALLSSWLDQELGIAGRIITRDGAQHLVCLGSAARLPQLVIHPDRSVNNGLRLDRQAHTQPVFTLDAELDLLATLTEQAGVRPGDVLGHGLFTYLSQSPVYFGLRNESFASSRLGNLSSIHTRLTVTEDPGDGDGLVSLAAFDHEKTGSATSSGAARPFLENMLEWIASATGCNLSTTKALLARGSCISADAGHLAHPNYSQHHDSHVDLVPNGGPMLRISANQHYATGMAGKALWLQTCEAAGVLSQVFVSNDVMPYGSITGPITAMRLGMVTADVDIGLLLMYPTWEMCGVGDPHHLVATLRAYLEG